MREELSADITGEKSYPLLILSNTKKVMVHVYPPLSRSTSDRDTKTDPVKRSISRMVATVAAEAL